MKTPSEKFCAFCGRPFDEPDSLWPRHCPCGEITYRNPIPVVNMIVPVKDELRCGVLVIQRGIEPCLGHWAFPGGYLELRETWQEGAARELWEETGLTVHAPNDSVSLLTVDMNPKRDRLIIFGIAPALTLDTLPKIPNNAEVTGARVIYEPEELAFPPHTNAAMHFFKTSLNSI